MFEKDKKRTDAAQMNGFIGKDVTINGKMEFDGSVRVDGHFNGEINAMNGTLIIGESAVLEAKVKVDTAIVSGEFRGEIEGKSRIELRAPAKMYGNTTTANLIIGEGVLFEGTCEMSEKKGGIIGLGGTADKKMEVL